MTGIIYMLGVRVKECGERAGHGRRLWAGAAIRLGLAIKGYAEKKIWERRF